LVIMKILITGASGKFGPLLARGLLDAGHEVSALVHSTPVETPGVVEVRGDITSIDDVARACEGVEAICHLATAKGNREKFLPVNLGGLFNVLEYLRALESPPQLVHLSGDNVHPIYDHPTSGPIGEEYPYLFVDDTYGLSKILEEVMAEQYVRKFDLPITVLRSSWIMEGRRIVTLCDPAKYGMKKYLPPELRAKLERGEKFRIVPLAADGQPLRRNVIDPRDLVRAFLAVLGRTETFGQVYNIAGEVFSHRELAKHLSAADGLAVHEVPVPDAHSFEIDISKAASMGFKPAHSACDTADWALTGGD
jgi:nucleoside-diphosphate-sugar epimerase